MNRPNIADTQKFDRKSRMFEILAYIKEAWNKGTYTDKNKLVAYCCMKYGSSRRTILEYLTILKDYGKIEINKNEIIPVKCQKIETTQKDEEKSIKSEPNSYHKDMISLKEALEATAQ